MPDIVDVVLAQALSPSGQIAAAAARATKAVSDAANAVSNIESITEQTNTNNTNAAKALKDAQDAITAANTAIETIGTSLTESIDDEIDKLTLTKTVDSTSNVIKNSISISYPSTETASVADIVKYYTATGQNTDGAMTQKAISDALEALSEQIGTATFDSSDAGKMVVIGDDGTAAASTITEEEIVEALLSGDDYELTGTVGIEIDYESKTFVRLQDAANFSAGSDFNAYNMYGGRMRCNVADDGTINAFYGDNGYTEDGSNGQVMVYQPAFYYMRIPLKTETIGIGKAIKKERILLSDTKKIGFKLHPLFKDDDGRELKYALFAAYEGCAYNNGVYVLNDATIALNTTKLSSISGAQPISGVNKAFTIGAAEITAQNRGSNWHITNMLVESANQMLEAVEFGTLNGQSALEAGITDYENVMNVNCAANTGSTANLGNATGHATTTIARGVEYTTAGYRAISYRGMENPWGNTWRMIGGFKIVGDGTQAGGVAYVCASHNYSDGSAYHAIANYIPYPYNYIASFSYDENYDWIFIPAETENANSALPVGDSFFSVNNLNNECIGLAGGKWSSGALDGPFCYSFDNDPSKYAHSMNARLLYAVEQNTIHTTNYNAWVTKMG